MTNTDNNGENNENQDQNESAADLYAQYRHLSNLQSNLTDVSQRANDAAAETNAERIRILARLRQQVLNNQSAMPQPLQIQIAAAIQENVDHQDGQQENDGPKEAHSQPNAPTADGNAIGSGSLRHRQRDYPSTSLPQPFAQRNGNTGKIQQLASAPPTLSCNQQHRQQEQQQEEELHHSEAEVQPLSGPNVEVIQIEDEEEEVEQENAIMEVDGSADEQNEANENIEQCQEEMHSGHRMTGEEQRSNLAEWDIIRDRYIAEFCANVQNEVMPEANNNVENEHPMNAENGPMNVENDPMNEEGQEVPAENDQTPNELIEPPQIEAIQQINVEENEGEEEVEYQNHCECNGGNNQEEEENVPGNVGGNQRERMNNVQGRKLKGRNPGEDWCKCCLFQVLFGHSLSEYKRDPELQKKFAEFLNRRTLVPELDEQLIEEFAQYLRQREANAEAGGQPKDGNQQPTAGPSGNDAGPSNVQSTSAQIPVPMPTANAGSNLNSSAGDDGNDRKKLEANRNIPKKPVQQKAAASPPNGPSTSTTFDEILASVEGMPSSSAGSNFNGRTLDQRLLQDVLPDSQLAQTNLASITEATLGQQEQNSANEQMDANEASQSHPSNSDAIQQNVEMSKKKAKPSPISTVNGQQNSQQSTTPQQQRNPPEQGIWMTSTSNFTPSPSNMANDVFEFPATSPPHVSNAVPSATTEIGQTPQNVVERTPLGAIHPNAANKKRRSDSPRKGGGEKRTKKAEKPAAGAAVLNPKYERIGGNGPRNVEILGNNGQQVGTTNEGNVGQQQSAAQHSSDAHPIASPPTPMSPNENVDHPSGTNPPKNVPKKKDCGKATPKNKKGWKPTINPHGPLAKKLLGMDNAPAGQPEAVQRQNSANDGQMRQSTSENIRGNANSVQPPPNSPVVRQQPSVVAESNQQENLAKKSAGTVAPQPAQAQSNNSANGPKIAANVNSVQSPANAKPPTVRHQQRPVDPRLGYAPPVVAKNNVNGTLAKKSAEMNPPQRPAAVHRQRSVNGQANEGQMRQSTSLNIGINANTVQRRDPGPALRDQNIIVSAMNNPKGQLAKTMGDPGAIRSLLAKPHSHKITGNANGERRPTVPAPNQRQNVANNGQIRQSTSTRPSIPPSIHGQQSLPATAAESNRQQQKSPGDQRGTGGTKRLRFLFGTATPADNGTPEAKSAGNNANRQKANGGNGPSNGQGTSNEQGTSTSSGVNHGPTKQGGNEAKKGATVAKSGQKPAPPPADDIIIPKSKFTDRSKPSAGGSRRNE